MKNPEIVVLQEDVHGMPISGYVEAIERRIPGATVRYARTPTQIREYLPTADIATGLTLDHEVLETATNLELFACMYAGTGHLDLDVFEAHGITVTSASGVHTSNISEYVVGAMIAFARQFRRALRQQERREWRGYHTRELHGSRATVVGLGAIGSAIVDRLQAFSMETVGVRYSPEKGGPTSEVYGFDEIHEAVADSEYVILACPLTETTEHLIDRDVFRTMHTDALLVNIARGPVVKTDDLVNALKSNAIAGATLDVTDPEPLPEDHPLWRFENVQITPHNSGHTPEYFERCADILAENVDNLRKNPDATLTNQVTSN